MATEGKPKRAPFWNLPKWFEYRKSIPVEQRSYTKIYGILAMLLFAFTVWAVLDEVLTRRPWKDIQAEFKEFKISRLQMEIKKARAKIPADVRKAVMKEYNDAMKATTSDSYLATMDKLEQLDIEIADAQRDYTFTKSEADEAYYHYDEAKIHREDTTSKAKHLRELEKQMFEEQKVVESLQKKRTEVLESLAPINKRLKVAETKRDSIFAEVISFQRKIEAVEKEPIAVHQTVLLNYEKTNFNNFKMRVDRCETCHLSFDDPMFKNDTLVSTDQAEIKNWVKKNKYNSKFYTIKTQGAKKDTTVAVISALFRMHPNVDLLIKGHKVGEPAGPGVLGCTSCHGGQGPSIVSTEYAHGFEKHWLEPLATGAYVEASCQTCHSSKMSFEGASWISMGKKLFTDFGCYGCHTMPGYENVSTQAPSLLNISKKVTPDWMYKWIKNPKGWEHSTRMPNFRLSDDETKAVTAFLIETSKSSTYAPVARYSGNGNPIIGKQTFFDVGCVGCHQIDEHKVDSRVKEGGSFGPALDKIGGKVTAEWLFDWLKNPKNYQAHSRMPSMRLTDGEASDITAYLMQHTGVNDSVKTSFDGSYTPDLVKKGEMVIRSYGCYGCHEIKGMENESKVSVALNNFGKKTPNELAYGNLHGETFGKWRSEFKKAGLPLGEVESHGVHQNRDWYTWVVGKMMNSRIYETERLPQKMPDFQMSKQEAFAISVFLRSQRGQYVGPTYAENPSDMYQQGLTAGRMFVHWNNCVGCHKVESSGGEHMQSLVNAKFAGDANIAYFAPPFLGPEGAKVQEQWLHSFLQGPFKIRPLVKFRMPSYGFSDKEIATATNYFLAMHKRPYVMTNYEYTPEPSLIAAGKELFDKVKCVSCHSVGEPTALTLAPNLAALRGRLRPEWVGHWIARPDSIYPGTPMTAFWYSGGKYSPVDSAILGGDPFMQIRAVNDYILSLGAQTIPAPLPYATINGAARYVLPNGDYRRAVSPKPTDARTEIKTEAKLLNAKVGKSTASR